MDATKIDYKHIKSIVASTQTTSYAYDRTDKLITTHSYDRANNLAQTKTPRDNLHGFTYDATGNRLNDNTVLGAYPTTSNRLSSLNPATVTVHSTNIFPPSQRRLPDGLKTVVGRGDQVKNPSVHYKNM